MLAAAAIALLLAAGGALELMRGNRRLARLPDVPPIADGEAPAITVVVAARNEQRALATALRSLLRQDYPRFDVVVVDDRSTDDTGEILNAIAATTPRLRVLHVDTLPSGWLGKNHALHVGAAHARGEWILFTDADVHFAPGVLARALGYAERNRLDHLAVAPALTMKGTMLGAFGAFFSVAFALFARPWRARYPGRWHVGIGAFNLLRREAYLAIGGHERIRLRPDDDMKLGKLVKLQGLRQDLLIGGGLVQVEWYTSVAALRRGLRKNALAGVDYRAWLLLTAVAVQLFLNVFTPLAAIWASGAAQACFAAATLLLLVASLDHARRHGQRLIHAAAFPLASLMFAWVVLLAVVFTYRSGGIEWREDRYPLRELRDNVV